MSCSLVFADSALPALERLLDCLGLKVEWKGEIGIVSTIEFDMAAKRDAVAKEPPVQPASELLKASPLHGRS